MRLRTDWRMAFMNRYGAARSFVKKREERDTYTRHRQGLSMCSSGFFTKLN